MIKRPISELPEEFGDAPVQLLFWDGYEYTYGAWLEYDNDFGYLVFYNGIMREGVDKNIISGIYHQTHFYYLSELEEGIPSVDDGRGEIDDLSPAARAESNMRMTTRTNNQTQERRNENQSNTDGLCNM